MDFLPLVTDRGERIDFLMMGLGWDPAQRRLIRHREIDLNATALLFDGQQLVDAVYHEQLTSQDGSVRHLGDSVTGDGKGDNEIISIDITRVPAVVDRIILLVTCYTGQTFAEIENPFCRLVDARDGTELLRHDLSPYATSGFVLAVLVRGEHGWQLREVADTVNAQHPVEAVPQMGKYLT
ncbi:TerD family protein [Nocardia carnea]|uniref:TerD family protein n=1 Tax=Nocardia carnea TaxID=37328 RepID=A0ABW7TSK2_9NOCA|nr:TerD family protein [Nocardia carnea]